MDQRRDPRAARKRRDRDDVVRITTAATSPRDDIRRRQQQYLISMAIRTVCVVGAVVVGAGALRWVLLVGAVFLPYVAVVLANATDRRKETFALPDAGGGHRQILGGGPAGP